MIYGLKLITCEKHIYKVFYPIGKVCPACFPEMYPLSNYEVEPGTVFITAGKICPECKGHGGIFSPGLEKSEYWECKYCNGKGVITDG